MTTVNSMMSGTAGAVLTTTSDSSFSLETMRTGKIEMWHQFGSPTRKQATPTSSIIKWIMFGTVSTQVNCTSNSTPLKFRPKEIIPLSIPAHPLN